MSGDSVPLREYVERIIRDHERAQQAQYEAAQKTVDVTAAALHEKLQEMNAFRMQLERERATYVQWKMLDPLVERVRMLEDRSSNLDGRFWALGVGLTILTTLLSLGLRFWVR